MMTIPYTIYVFFVSTDCYCSLLLLLVVGGNVTRSLPYLVI